MSRAIYQASGPGIEGAKGAGLCTGRGCVVAGGRWTALLAAGLLPLALGGCLEESPDLMSGPYDLVPSQAPGQVAPLDPAAQGQPGMPLQAGAVSGEGAPSGSNIPGGDVAAGVGSTGDASSAASGSAGGGSGSAGAVGESVVGGAPPGEAQGAGSGQPPPGAPVNPPPQQTAQVSSAPAGGSMGVLSRIFGGDAAPETVSSGAPPPPPAGDSGGPRMPRVLKSQVDTPKFTQTELAAKGAGEVMKVSGKVACDQCKGKLLLNAVGSEGVLSQLVDLSPGPYTLLLPVGSGPVMLTLIADDDGNHNPTHREALGSYLSNPVEIAEQDLKDMDIRIGEAVSPD